MSITIRHAQSADDLAMLWPDIGQSAMNREQVFVAVDEADTLLGGSLMFHGGHSLAYVGSTVIIAPERRAWVAQKLMRFAAKWCRERGITRVAHGAGTTECCDAFLKLGATITRYHALMELEIKHG